MTSNKKIYNQPEMKVYHVEINHLMGGSDQGNGADGGNQNGGSNWPSSDDVNTAKRNNIFDVWGDDLAE